MSRLMLWCLLGIGVWFGYANVSAQDALSPLGLVSSGAAGSGLTSPGAVSPGLASPGLAGSGLAASPVGSAERRGDPVIRRAPLDVVVLSDPSGNPIFSLPGGWSLTVMDDIYRLLMDQQDPTPPFIIRNVAATGTVAGNFVEAHVQIELTTSGSQPVRIPLGFREGILPSEDRSDVPSFRYAGPGSAALTVDPQEEQYIAIVTPYVPRVSATEGTEEAEETEQSNGQERPETSQHTLSLVLWLPLAPNGGDEERLSLSFPQSNSSEFLLEVPMTNVIASVARGVLLDIQENDERQSTLLRMQGLRTDTEITWRKQEIVIIEDHPVLLVEGAAIDIRLDDRSTVYTAMLPVSSATGSFDQLQIRLPQGSVLDREMSERYAAVSNYSIEEVSGDSVVTVRFPQSTTGPVSIHLRAVQQFEGGASDFRRELAGFEVLDAERQTGTLAVSIFPSEMRSHWEPGRGIRRTEGGGSGNGEATRFEFISQPFLLGVQVAAPQIRINVRPDYQFRISRGMITLDARLSYTVSGSGADVLYLRLPDSQWHLDFGMSSLVDHTSVVLDESGLLTMPLRSSTEGTFPIEFRAHRAIEAEEEQRYQLVLPIPRPEQVTWSEPAPVAIVPVHNVEVLPIEQETRGLTRLPRRVMPLLRVDTADTHPESLSYRAELPDALFVADLFFHQPQLSATMQTDVRMFEEYNQVTQTISYNVAFSLEDRVYVLLPRVLETSGDVQVQWGNRALELRDTVSPLPEGVSDNWVQRVVQLPESVSQFSLTFQYSRPPLIVADDDTVPFALPLITPAEVPVTDHRIHFFTPTGYRMELQPESRLLWESFREPRRPLNVTETFRSTQSPTRIALLVSAVERTVSGTTVVERAWLQTWLTSNIREDRATYLLRSTNDSVTLQLPPDAMRDHRVRVQVDRQPIQPNISPTGVLTIPILPEQYNRPIEVSIYYRYSFEMSAMRVPLILPSFPRETLVQYQFWQVILRQSQHIIGVPVGWTLEYDWSWNGLFWWRVPSIRKSDIGFAPDSEAIEASISGSSQYVFSHLQPTSHVTLYIVNRSSIILFSSSIALFIGLILIYVSQSRYAGSLLGLGIVLLAVLFYQPPLVLLMLQAATFGVFLALGAGYLYRIFHRQKQWIPPTFPMMDDLSQPYPTPVPPSQTIHEVIIDESGSKEPSGINNQHHQ